VNGFELAALYTAQDGLARNAEGVGGLRHGGPAGRASSTKSLPTSSVIRIRHGAWSELLASDEPIASQRCRVDGARPGSWLRLRK
jgi:hypothetical protein